MKCLTFAALQLIATLTTGGVSLAASTAGLILAVLILRESLTGK